ncbi:hypothetical protein SAMN05660330_02355 [Desulforhopalus singaporensis]|uniref:Uncharacterized protein n=1 Tax=Desulforhopalus singaporensis TaxID=91360 RepID=A0A1H0RL39_9BACT|nr:hypothetical protein SAMN05660330_02355 [Desulforhopalus singaporensis]
MFNRIYSYKPLLSHNNQGKHFSLKDFIRQFFCLTKQNITDNDPK